MTDWLAHLPSLIPLSHIPRMLDLTEDHPERLRYQDAAWLIISALKALHIEPELKTAVRAAGIEPGMHVLDLGCGAALKARFLLDCGVETVTGIDLDPDELALAHRLPNPYADRLRLIEADALARLPFAKRSFDAVFIGDGFIDFYTDKMMDALRRVLRPDGLVILATTNILPGTLYAWDRPLAARVEAARWVAMMDSGYGELVAATDATYERRFLQRCAKYNLTITHYPVSRSNPVPPVFEQLVQHTFAAFDATILQPYLSPADWHTLRHIHDPQAPEYLFTRSDAAFLQVLTVATGQL